MAWGVGVVGEPQAHAGIAVVEGGELFQQRQVQRRLADPHEEGAGLQGAVPLDLLLPQAQLLIGRGHPLIEPFPLRRQGDAPVGADEELAAQGLLQVVHAAGDVGLVVLQHLGCPGEAAALGHIVEKAVVVIGDGHGTLLSGKGRNWCKEKLRKTYKNHIATIRKIPFTPVFFPSIIRNR